MTSPRARDNDNDAVGAPRRRCQRCEVGEGRLLGAKFLELRLVLTVQSFVHAHLLPALHIKHFAQTEILFSCPLSSSRFKKPAADIQESYSLNKMSKRTEHQHDSPHKHTIATFCTLFHSSAALCPLVFHKEATPILIRRALFTLKLPFSEPNDAVGRRSILRDFNLMPVRAVACWKVLSMRLGIRVHHIEASPSLFSSTVCYCIFLFQ